MKIYHSFWDYGYRELTNDLYNMHKLSALLALENYDNIHLITTEKGKEFLEGIPYTSVLSTGVKSKLTFKSIDVPDTLISLIGILNFLTDISNGFFL